MAQALFLLNDSDILERIADPKGRLTRLLKTMPDDNKLMDELYLSCLSRLPTAKERQTVLSYVQSADSRREAMQDVMWSLLNIREFMFVK